MSKSAKSKAEERFAKIQRQDRKSVTDRQKAEEARGEKVKRLRALRLARDGEIREAAERKAASAAGGSRKKTLADE